MRAAPPARAIEAQWLRFQVVREELRDVLPNNGARSLRVPAAGQVEGNEVRMGPQEVFLAAGGQVEARPTSKADSYRVHHQTVPELLNAC